MNEKVSPSALARELGITRQAAHQRLNRHKSRARVALRNAVLAGTVIRPEACERCSAKVERLEAHHADYARPLYVSWFCPPCHSIEHPHSRALSAKTQGAA